MMFAALNWLTVNQLVTYHSLIAVYKIRKSNEPEYLFNLLSNDNFQGQIVVLSSQLSLCKRSFCFRVAKSWNIPESIRSIQTLVSFKRELETWLKIQRFL